MPIHNTLESIRNRRTLKMLSDTPLASKPRDHHLIETLIESAYYAPQHYPCFAGHQQHLPSPLPWRFYVADSHTCRQLASWIVNQQIDAGKILGMLNTADFLILSTWCPLPSNNQHSDILFDGNLVNMEHIAATGAAIQNILLTATALGYENYWSSGGILREQTMFERLHIPIAEILLGAVFIFPILSSESNNIQQLPSKRRHQRGLLSDSYRFISL